MTEKQNTGLFNHFFRKILTRKNPDEMLQEANKAGLEKTLGALDLIILGIGAIIGSGIFAVVGIAAAGGNESLGAGPGLVVSMIIATFACIFSALCYSEFATMIPVAGIGTGGTAIGIKKGLGDKAKVYGVEPFESPLITNGVAGPHKIQGIGANFITDIYKSGELDGVMTVKGDDAIKEARNLAKTKGIMCGISSGANLYAAKELAKQNPNKLIVTIMCDFGERYLSTELFE